VIGTAEHYGINVSDIDDALEFYEETLGFEFDRRFPISDVQSTIVGVDGVEGEIAFLDAGPCDVELIAYDAPPNSNANEAMSNHDVGATHFCLDVDDLDAVYEDLRDDVDFISPPQEVTPDLDIAYAYDPDGNVVEFKCES